LPDDFAGLAIPLKVVATDFYGSRDVVLQHGPLYRALAASAALPVLFRPVRIDDCIMMDGGITNPLPVDIVAAEVDVIVAVDVIGGPVPRHRRFPTSTEAIFGASQLFMQSIAREKMLRSRPPDVLVRPPANDFRVLEFLKAEAIIKAAEPVKDEVKRLLDRAIAG
jgi:NTE family protein